ncbi:metallophosphoesterase [Sphingomonas donggukensis]|uniref:Metallophosphoesterase n=1 Tax=Sphingomonas donggukensis TaxID=2949093 RepID=A0ABY4TPZ5_9SPHN|nr:metallophosphoesterase [Sphingomonas donggukensis]URW74456.1 metallophosphoesterase [Sphingomonas donggukensis]
MRFFRSRQKVDAKLPADASAARVPEGVLVHAIGDVHGRLDLLSELLGRIADDVALRDPSEHRIVLLGDLIDRGPDSAGVVELCATYDWRESRPDFVIGNHEELMLNVLDGDPSGIRFWIDNGGDATLRSYGLPPDIIDQGTAEQIMAALSARVPAHHIRFLHALCDYLTIGDYWFVHAGIRPGLPLARQKPKDLRWIRGAFLDHAEPHGGIVVHGHTISPEVDAQPNRIGIDTGAYETGRLTALGLWNTERWHLQTGR